MRMKECLLFLTVAIIGLGSCNGNPNPKKSRLFIVQEVDLDDGRSLFWFREEQEGSHEGISYFQITNDICELSVNKAHAHCSSPVQIYHFFGDTIFILTHTSLVITRSDSWFTLKAIQYSPELYDSNKNPESKKQFFLDSLCAQKK
jgi:hypothetical protein